MGPNGHQYSEQQDRLRVVLIFPTFSENMGYLGNTLPKYLAREGADVHVITTDLPHNYQIKEFNSVYGRARGLNELCQGTVRSIDGYTLHVMPHAFILGQMRIPGLLRALKKLKPDVVQVLVPIGLVAIEVAFGSVMQRFRLFTGCHQAASMFPLARGNRSWFSMARIRCLLTRGLHGRVVSLATEKCYAVTRDCADIAITFFGVERSKVEVMHLCTEVESFHPPITVADRDERARVREGFGFSQHEIVCIYTGKLTLEKNALILAQAVAGLRSSGFPFRTLIVGNGPQSGQIAEIDGSIVVPFVPYSELPPLYRCADIGVWPTNESTSMLDAAASGLPLVVSDGIVYRDHVEGNGLVVRMGDREDLMRVLVMLKDGEVRSQLGSAGAAKMARDFNCQNVARRRLSDYSTAVLERETSEHRNSNSVRPKMHVSSGR